MEIGETFYPKTRAQWRRWLEKNHDRKPDVWLITFRKHTGKPSVDYNDAVEEALCFGWIDSIFKSLNEERKAQRFSPRRPRSNLSETNKERIRRLVEQGKMTPAGMEAVKGKLDDPEGFTIPPDIFKALKKDRTIWKNFQAFPDSYKRVRVGWIEGARGRPEIFQTRLNYFLEMTQKNKRYGQVQ